MTFMNNYTFVLSIIFILEKTLLILEFYFLIPNSGNSCTYPIELKEKPSKKTMSKQKQNTLK